MKVAEEVQAGNFATRAIISGGEDEITKLAYSLNQMLDGLARNEGKLREASHYTRSLIEASLDPLVTIDPDGKITDVNEATMRATGIAREALVGSDFSNYFTEPDKARAGYREVYAKGFVTDYPLAIRHASGAVTDVLYNASLYRDEKGEVAGVFAAARDITERKRIEERNSQLAAIVESSDDAIFSKTLEGVITSWNKGAELIYGYTQQEVVGREVSILMPPGREHEMSSHLALIREGRHILHFETLRRRKDGKEIYVSLTLSPVKDAAGHIIGVSAIERDVTERKHAEDALRQREADLHEASLYTRSLIEASLDPLVTISADGKITDVNEATMRATGIAREALVGSDFSNYFTEPDKARAGYREVYAKGFVTDYPLAIRHVSGTVTDVLYNASLYRDEKGQAAGVFAAARDVSALKRAEQDRLAHLRFLESMDRVNRAQQGTNDLDRMMRDVLGVVLAIFDCDRAWLLYPCDQDATSFQVPMEITRPEYPGAGILNADVPLPSDMAQNLREALESADPVTYAAGTEKPINKVSAEQFGVKAMMMTALYPRSGKPWAFGLHQCSYARTWTSDELRLFEEIGRRLADGLSSLLLFRDLREEREHLEELVETRTAELTTANGGLESANRELEAFAYSVSHDLRVPLRAIDGFSRILLEDYSGKIDAEGQRLLNVVRDNTVKMARLIDDILAFSRAGRSEITSAPIDMDGAVRAVLEELEPAAAGRKLTFDIKPLAPAQGDAAMIQRVWTNLIDNAIKFTALQADAVIEIGSTAGEKETTYYVKDNGAGFDMQYADKLFGVFQRLHGAEFAGTGIGLAIVKRIVARHGGRVWAEGKVNEGATFYFTLPIREDSHA